MKLLALLLGILILGDPEEYANYTCYEDYAGSDVSAYLVGGSALPLLESGLYGSGSTAGVTVLIVVVVVLVGNGSGLLTNVTVGIAVILIGVSNGSGSLTNVTLGVAGVVVLVGGLSGSLTNVTLGIASVVVLVSSGSGGAANITLSVAVVIELVLLAGLNGLFAVFVFLGSVDAGVIATFGGVVVLAAFGSLATFGAGLFVSEYGYSGHAEQYAKNCQKSCDQGKMLLHKYVFLSKNRSLISCASKCTIS